MRAGRTRASIPPRTAVTGAPPWRLAIAVSITLLLAACGTTPKKPAAPPLPGKPAAAASIPPSATPGFPRRTSPYAPAQEDLSKRGDYVRGGLYAPHIADSAPGDIHDIDAIPEPDVVAEPRAKYGNKSPYTVVGKSYRVRDSADGYDETGTASYYGNKFHGRRTSSQEVYDMYAFTAAHRTLPLPSFARVTNLDNGRSVVVRVNDRGPFHDGRLIDLSFAAAVKLGIHPRGTGRVEVIGLSPGENASQRYDAVASAATNPAPGAAAPLTATPAGNGALRLPPGVRIATGKPQAMPPTAIDTFVQALPSLSPVGTAAAAERSPHAKAMPSNAAPTAERSATPPSAGVAQSAPPPTASAPPASGAAAAPAGSDLDWRFDMSGEGRAMTADQFDAWMKSRRARVATGKAGVPDPYGSAAPGARAPAAASTDKAASVAPKPAVETIVAAREADAPKPLPAPATVAGGVTLQVAAFGARANAERALSMLKGAGVDEARVYDGTAAGKPVWRVRIGPVAGTRVADLTTRVAGLGFGQPQVVRE